MLDNIEEIEKKLGFSDRVRIYFGVDGGDDKRVYRKNQWIIPIGEDNGRFMTYQDLTYDKMTGKTPLTEEEAKKYPVVVNPEIPLKIQHNVYLDKNDDMDRIKIVLAYTSGKIAIDKSKYEGSAIHDGYFIDKDRIAIEALDLHEKKRNAYEILSKIESVNLGVYCEVAKIQNGVNIQDFEGLVNERIMSKALYDQIDKNPDIILKLDEKNNPNFKEEIFIAFAVKNELIRRRGLEFYLIEDGIVTSPMGKTINQVISYMRDNIRVRDNIMRHLAANEIYYQEKADAVIYGDLNKEQVKDSIWTAITGGRGKLEFDKKKAEEMLNVLYKAEGNSPDYIELQSEYLTKLADIDIANIEKESTSYTQNNIQGYNITIKDVSISEDLKRIRAEKMDENSEGYEELIMSMRERMKEAQINKIKSKLQEEINLLNN